MCNFSAKVFKVEEKPIHEFQGHNGDVLDLSWSTKRFLLSSSIDHTVHLWQVGCDSCRRVFSHNNYVTCVDFNPSDDNYFISVSIDGKARIWEVDSCQVVNYTALREIVTAVCYYPDGKGEIVGTMTGNCLFYDIIDHRLELNAQISLQGKKKVPGRRITGFEPLASALEQTKCEHHLPQTGKTLSRLSKIPMSTYGIAIATKKPSKEKRSLL